MGEAHYLWSDPWGGAGGSSYFNRGSTLVLQRGGEWLPLIRWIFTSAPLTCPHSPFIRRLLAVWRRLWLSLLLTPPSSQEEVDWQPLIWNGQLMDGTVLQLRERSHIAWDGWACGPARSLRVWRDTYRHLEMATLVATARGVHGAQVRRTEIDEAIPARMVPPMAHELMLGDARWLG